MRRVLVVEPYLEPRGGGEGVCAWILQALQDDHDLTLLSWERPAFDALNRFYGTRLDERRIRVRQALPLLPDRLRRGPRLRRLRQFALLALARRSPDVDLLVSVEEESDLGGGGIQYVHFPMHDPRPLAARPWLQRTGFTVYHRLIAWATGTSAARMRDNVTVVNSGWTGARVREVHGIDSITIHPPAAGDFPDVPFSARASDFLCVGRFSPEKRFELAIDIVAGVRARGHDVRLHIVATGDDRRYAARIAGLAARHAWVTLERSIARSALVGLMSRCRYGIHAMAEEHYGMATAEMVRAGMIVFVPRGGGQVEIVEDERLLWSTPGEAVERIVAVLTDERLADALARRLTARREHLGPARFVREVRALVARVPDRAVRRADRGRAAG